MNPLTDHWLSRAKRVFSPNHNQRPDESDISLLVVHNISLPAGVYGGGCIERLFTNCLDCDEHASFEDLRGLRVSSHLLIGRQGELTQFVPFNLRAWHAGESHYRGRDNCNDFSIGIELEGVDDCPYTEQQYQVLAQVTGQLFVEYAGLNREAISGHCDIAPGRKTDPGAAFDWEHFYRLLDERR